MSTTRSNPVQVAGYVAGTYSAGPKLLSTSWSKVSVGPSHVIAIKSNNTLWAWGANDLGQLGDGTVISRSSPVQVGTSPTYAWYDVSAGNNFSAALRDDRLLYVWGLNTSGQLGQITDVTNKSSPVQVLAGSWKAVSAGGTHVVAIDSANKLWAWGLNSNGQLGLLDYNSRSSPTQVGTSSWTIISAGNIHTTAINSDSGLFTWGTNAVGQLGYTVTPVPYSWTQVAGNADITVAIRNDGLLFTWGNNATGQLGDGTIISKSSPVQIGTSTWSFVGTIGATTGAGQPVFAIASDGKLWGWGLNTSGQLGDGTILNRSSPVQVSGGGSWIAISASKSHAVALKSDFTLYTWGLGTSGQLGDGITSRSSPVKVGTSSWTKVSAGELTSFAIRTDGALFSWGSNANGQQGDLNVALATLRSSPTQIGAGSWTNIFANGGTSIFAIDVNNKLFAWGLGTTGQLGYDGAAVSRSSPVQISSGNWSSLAESNTGLTTLALQTDGSLWAWGAKTNFLLSEFSNTTFTYSWSQISAGPSHTAAIRSDGRLYTWGLNTSGQIGDFTTVNKSSPVLISARGLGASGEFWNSVSANGSRTVAVRADGTLWAWGNNTGYLLGTNDGVSRSQPVQIGVSQTTTVSTYTTLYSTYFNGVSDYITIPDNATLELGANNFTIECWIYPTSTASGQIIVNKVATGSVVGAYDFRFNGDTGALQFFAANASGASWAVSTITTTGVKLNNWNHVAYVRNTGGVFTAYINGVAVGTQTNNITLVDEATTTNIGANGNGTSPFAGYITNLRITKGQALYTANFTPSTTPLTTTSQSATATNVILLACQNTTIIDNSIANTGSTPWTLTVVGGPIAGNTLTPFSGYVTVNTSWTKVSAGLSHALATRSDGGLFAWGDNTYQQLGLGTVNTYSTSFNGTTDYLSSVNNTALDLSTSTPNWTIECWIYPTSTSGSPTIVQKDGQNGTRQCQYALALDGSGKLYGTLSSAVNSFGNQNFSSSGAVIQVNAWTHVAFVRSGSSIYMFQNGQIVNGPTTLTATMGNNTGDLTVGINTGPAGYFSGYISNLRIIKGTAQYTSAFTPSTSPLTAITNTSLLTLQNSTAIDNSGNNLTITRTGSPTATLAISPFGALNQVGISSWTQISAGGTHSLAIDKNNLLYAWGDNTLGQTGQLATPLQWTSVSSYWTTQMIRSDGIVFTMGLNNGGQLGDSSTIAKSSPVQLSGGGSWRQIVSSYDQLTNGYSIGIKSDGTLYTWGLNSSGILGDNTLATTVTRSSPVLIPGSSWLSVSTMDNTAIAIRSDYTLWSWGRNESGQLGDNTVVSKSSPVQITGSWSQISVGRSSAMATRTDGTLYTWGLNSNAGQLGDNTVANKSSPVQVGVGNSYIQISGKSFSKFAIRNDYTLWSWGINTNGQLGLNDIASRSSPVQVNSEYYFDDISSGFDHIIGKRRDGTIWGWGLNTSGQVGDGTVISRSSPVQVGTSSWVSVNAGYKNTFGITTSGVNGLQNLYAWGNNVNGEFGLIDTASRSSPVQIGSGQQLQSISSPTQIGTSSWSAISAGLSHSIAVRSDYKLYAWGDNSVRQTGYITPATVLSTSNKTNNDAQSYIRSTDNALIIWGANDVGQLGDNTVASKSNPVQLGLGFGNSQFAKIARAKVASAGYTLGVKTDGTLWAWGSGANGVLGNSTTTNRSSPVQVGTLTTWSDVAAGPSHALAIKTDGSLWGWGLNSVGQAGRISWAKISSGSSHTLALRSDGALYGWGSNTAGQVGDITIVNRSSPVQIGSSSWNTISAGINVSAAIRGDNLLFTWGNNANGAIGDGTTVNRSSPVQVGIGNSRWTQVSARDYMMAISSGSKLYTWGINTNGQLGSNNIVTRSSPVQVGSSQTGYNSVLFNGTSQYITLPGASTAYTFGTNDFTVEAWIYLTLAPTAAQRFVAGTSSGANGFAFGVQGVASQIYMTTSTVGYGSTGASIPINVWVHLAWIRQSSNIIMFINGNIDYTTTASTNITETGGGIGSLTGPAAFPGYISNLRVINNQALYTAKFTPSTSPLTKTTVGSTGAGVAGSITGTVTLLACQDITFIDNSNTNNTLTPVASPVVSGEAPFSTGTSVTQISAGTAGLFTWSTGALYGMGLNTTGQIGDGTVISRSFPVQISGSWSVVSTSNNAHTLAIRSTDSALFAWGLNTSYQIGDGTSVNKSSPVQINAGTSYTNVYAGTNYSLAIKNDNTLWSWGSGPSGQLGIVIPLSWTLSNSIGTHPNDFTLWAWGDNTYGQLGISSTLHRSSPVQIGTTSWTYTYSTTSNAYAIKSDGTMWAWGRNYFGQLGLGDTTDRSSPVQIGTDTNWSTVVASATGHALAIKTTGTLYAWGYNQYNELGLNQPVQTNYSTPQLVGSSSWTKISAGNNFSLAITSTSLLYAWGKNDYGQTGNPINAPLSWTTVAGGDSYSVAIRSDGKLFSWGRNDKGQLGLGHTANRSTPTQIAVSTNYKLYSTQFPNDTATYLTLPYNAAFGAGTGDFTLEVWIYTTAIGADRMIIDGGNNAAGRATTSHSLYLSATGTIIYLPGGNAVINAGLVFANTWTHLAVVRIGGFTKLYINGIQAGNTYTDAINYGIQQPFIGRNSDGAANPWTGYISNLRFVKGTGLYTTTFIPPVSALTNVTNTSYLILQNDSLIDNGTANTGSTPFTITPTGTGITTTTLTPFQTTAYNYSFTQVSATLSHVLAIRNDGGLFAWGANDVGQLGQGDTALRSAPVQIGSSSWIGVGAGSNTTYAIRTDGALFTAGDNTYGQLAQSDITSRSSLTQIPGTTSWTSISSSATGHTLGITSTGTLYGWGYNQYNELGQNDRNPIMRSAPVQVGSATTWTKVSAGNNFSLGISAFGLWAWGKNDYGQAPPATGTVLTPLSWTQVAGGDSYSVAIRNDGKLFSWGLNSKGQLGLGHTINRSAPTQIALSTNANYFSTAFNGTNDALTLSSGVLPTSAGTAFTFEGWFYLTRATSAVSKIFAGGNTELNIDTVVAGQIRFDLPTGTTNVMNSGTTVMLTNLWYHIAITRTTGNLYTLYLNGISVGSGSQGTASTAITSLGAQGQTNPWQGYMYGVRTVTSLLYTGNFTPSNSPPTAISGTTLLTCMNYNFTDISGTQTVTVTAGSTGISPSTIIPPMQTTAYNYSFTQVSATLSHVLAIRADGALFAWGANNAGQLGQGDTTTRSSPIQIGTSSWTRVAAGSDASFAIRGDNSYLYGWGDNTNGILGQSNTTSVSSPLVISSGTSWTNISATQHILATTNLGAMYAWGLNNAGQLGTTNINAAGDVQSRSAPVQIGSPNSWNLVAAGSSFSMATGSTGLLYTWGLGTSGQLGGAGNGTTTAYGNTSRSSPSQIGASSWSVIAAGTSWAAGISGVRLYHWGGSANYENGAGTTLLRSSPVQIGVSSWTTIGGTTNPIGIMSATAGTLFGWGIQAAGQLGLNDVALRSSPVQIASLTGLVFDNASSPVQIGTTSWTNVQAGTRWGAGVTTAGTLFTWGFGINGELASGATTARSSPVQVAALTTWSKLAGTTHVLGTLTTGTSTLVAWGAGTSGQLGNNTVTSVSSPVAVNGLLTSLTIDSLSSPTQIGASSWTQISAGDAHTLATRLDFGLFTWGRNDQGQVGSGVTTSRSSPVQVNAGTSYTQLAAGIATGAAITNLGGLFTWGLGINGQLGSSATTSRSAPVQVGSSSWSLVSSVKDTMLAVTGLNQLFAWGNNIYGQLGVGDTANRSSPTQVGTTFQTTYSTPVAVNTSSKLPSSTYAVSFNGLTDYLQVTYNTALNLSGTSFTIEFWTYSTATNSATAQFVSKDGVASTNQPAYLVYLTTGQLLRFSVGDSTGASTVTHLTSATLFPINQWVHVAVTMSGTAGAMAIYQNGVLVASNASSTPVIDSGRNLYIGYQQAQSASNYLNGYMSNLRIIKGQVLYTGTFTPSTSPLTTSTVGATGSGAAASISGTVSLLTCQSPAFIDNSGNNLNITPTSGPGILGYSYNQISASDSNSMAIDSATGIMITFGDSTTGQIGDSSTVAKYIPTPIAPSVLYDSRSSPAQIGTGSWSQIAAGLNYSIAIKNNSTLWSWGDNTAGYLGDGTTATKLLSMVQIGTSSYTSISSGGSHTVALKTDSTLYAWGLNNAGQLGDNSVVSRSSPVQVNTSLVTSWNSVSAGASHTNAIDATYNLPYGWGLNSSGQIGDNTLVNKSAPVQITLPASNNYSYQFNGSNYLSIASNTALNLGTGDYTIEGWWYFSDTSNQALVSKYGDGGGGGFGFVVQYQAGNLRMVLGNTLTAPIDSVYSFAWTPSINTWYHITITRSGTNGRAFVNGTQIGSTQTFITTNSASALALQIGSTQTVSEFTRGYVSNLRIIKGTALYTTGFYPSTGALTTTSQGATASQVSLLTAQNATIVDNSSNAFTITNTGTVTASGIYPFGPYYSGSFNGTSSYLTISSPGTNFSFGSGNFTVEAWIYNSAPINANSKSIFDLWAVGTSDSYKLFLNGNNRLQWAIYADGTADVSALTIPNTTWTHIAWTRSGSNVYLFINGVLKDTTGTTYTANGTANPFIGKAADGSGAFFNGYISNLRVVKGTAVYTGNFTPPTNILRTTQSAMTNIVALTGTETSFLTLQNATIVDNSTNVIAITNVSVTVTTAYAPFSASVVGVTTAWDSIQAGVTNTMGTSNNTLFTWGAGTTGQLGDNTITGKSAPTATGVGSIWSVAEKLFSSPVQVGTAYSWTTVAAGAASTMGITSLSTLWLWGSGIQGDSGDSTTVSKSSPTQIGSSSFVSVSAGTSTAFAINTTTRLLYAWGYNSVGQLGLADLTSRSSPVQVFAGTTTSPLIPIKLSTVSGSSFTQVQAGSAATVISSIGLLYAWGTNTTGQVGDGSVVARSSPVQVGGPYGASGSANSPTQVGVRSWSQVAAGNSHTLAIDSNSSLWAWGKTPANGATANRSSPVQIGSSSWVFVSAGNDVSQAIGINRTLYVWGLNTNYQLGSASFSLNQSVTSPVAIGTLGIINTSHTTAGGAGNGGFIKNI